MREMRRNWLANQEPLDLREQTFVRHVNLQRPARLAAGLEVGSPLLSAFAAAARLRRDQIRPGDAWRLGGSPALSRRSSKSEGGQIRPAVMMLGAGFDQVNSSTEPAICRCQSV